MSIKELFKNVPTKFPTLYKLSTGGKLQVWDISVVGTAILTVYGQEDGVKQVARDTVRSGKNAGKANATTVEEQAAQEAKAKWTKQIARQGYVEDRARALAKETDAAGGIAPMLAQPLEKTKHIVFPCDAQRKYNGVRLIAVVEQGTCTLWSRKRTRILGLPHIEAAYRTLFAHSTDRHVFDGEAYVHGWTLQKLSGYARTKEPKEGFENIKHYVYDYPSHDATWRERVRNMHVALRKAPSAIQTVEDVEVNDMEEVKKLHNEWVAGGYEGVILRNLHAPYEEGKRSYHLAKYKTFKDAEFEIVAVREGRGKFEGLAVFGCVTHAGKQFDCCAPGTLEDRAEFMKKGDKLIGKKLTVKFFDWTEDGIPQFPVGVAVRDYE